MVTDAMLQTAAAEVSQCILDNLPDAAFCEHKFSKKFENKMRRLIRRADHPVRYQVFRGVVAAVLAAIILFGGVLALSPEVRAEVINWFRERIYGYAHYYSPDDTQPAQPGKYIMTYVSDNWTLLELLEEENLRSYIYITPDNKVVQFTTLYTSESSHMFIPTEGSIYQSALVSGQPADLYLADDLENNNNYIVWTNEADGLIFCIGAPLEIEELIMMAESVEIIIE